MNDTTHRRDFVRTIALGASASALTPSVGRGADAPEPAGPPKPEAEKPPTEVEARMNLVLARFGDKLDDDARREVRGQVAAIVSRAEALRKFPLDNGDAPFAVFSPYRAPLAGGGGPAR